MLPTLHSMVQIPQGTGIVLFVGAAHFLVRLYDVADVTVYVCDAWRYAA